VLLLTLWSVQRAVARADAEHRWCLIGLGASVAGLAVEECAGVGLRVSEVPVAFYTVLGLTWAASHLEPGRTVDWAATRSWRRTSLAAVALTAALAAMTVTQVDFASARRTYQAQQDMTQGKLEDALRLSTPSLWRLSPQRQLYGDSLRVDSHVRWAERMIHRATERDQKARGTEPIDARVIELAHQDIYFAEEAIKAGGQILKELVQRSPAYMNSGLLEYRINLVRAQAALIRGDHEGTEASRKNAVAALDRELQRQPFRADIAEAFSRFALPEVPLDRVLLVLARPLRLGPLGESTVQRVESLSQSPDFGPAFSALFSGRSSNGKDQASDWLPELLRLGAALNFVTGQYDRARAQLESAAELYVALTPYPALAAAAVHLELAESQFFAEPENPDRAVTAANKAYAMAPHSRLGREFQADVQSRLILYLLAADRERDALEILRRLAPKRMPDDLLRRELGQRLRLLCEALLLRRREAVVLRKPADDLAPRLQRWIDRAIELDPDDMAARFLAADLAVHVGEAEAAARRVREALERGLHPADALAFLRMALERLPGSDPLASLHSELEQSGDLASDKQEP
jgi:tetratricopeptide (TPR) repeat protein